MNDMKTMALFLLFFSTLITCAQEVITLTGTVYDDSNGIVLPFAQIGFAGTNTGTVTNGDGRFILTIPSIFEKDSLIVSYLGYSTLRLSVRELDTTQGIRIGLKPKNLQLPEFEIFALTPEQVIRKVVENIPRNYGADPLVLTAFVRSQKYSNGALAEFTEAMIENKKLGYTLYPDKEIKKRRLESNVPLLLKGRVVSDTSLVEVLGEIGRNAGCLGCNFVHDFVEFYHETVFDEEQFRFYTFSMKEEAGDHGKIYHIRYDQRKGVKKKLWRGEIWVNAADFALLKIVQKPSFEAFDTYEKSKMKSLYYIDHQYGWYAEMPRMEWTVTYNKRSGFYYLSTIRIENWITFIHGSTGRKFRFSHKNEVVVTDAIRDPEKLANFRGDKSTGVNQRWDEIITPGNDRFWENQNYIPLDQAIREKINKLLNK
jgi:hypothetical protein